MKKKIRLLIMGVCLFVFPVRAQIQREYRIVAPHTIESKNYYFTSLLQNIAQVDSMVRTSSVLTRMAHDKQQRLENANTTEARIAAMKFSNREIEEAADALAELYEPDNVLGHILSAHVIPSGCYQQYRETGAELVRRIWRQDAEGMNYAVDVYAAARKPNYPAVDSIGFDVRSRRFVREILPACQQNIACWNSMSPAFYSVPLRAVRMLLDVNDRSQALDYEPLAETENRKAYAQVRLTDWGLILIPPSLYLEPGRRIRANQSVLKEGCVPLTRPCFIASVRHPLSLFPVGGCILTILPITRRMR